jgi:tetratricopeptide (TPR) repeat protein
MILRRFFAVSHLRSLAPSPRGRDPDASIRCINEHEPKPEIFGREVEIKTIIQALLAHKTVLVAGGPGMGKTAVATAALYDPEIVSHFGRRRIFASLEAATEPRAILAKLVDTLGLPSTGDEASLLRILEAVAAERPLAAVLDNVETVFDKDSDAERLLNLVAALNGLALVVTIRGVPPAVTGAVPIDDLPKLGAQAARRAFLAISGDVFASDPDLSGLLDVLDGHALSIRLVAAQAAGLPVLAGLRESWDDAHAEILRRPGHKEGRLTSVRASLLLSLNSGRMNATPLARRLMSLLAYVPGGLDEPSVAGLLGDRGAVSKVRANEAISCLYQLRLLDRRLDRRLRMLTPLRECVKLDVPMIEADKARIIGRYLTLAEKARNIGSKNWEQVREQVETEADNLDSVCQLAVEANISERRLGNALMGLGEFHLASGRGAAASFHAAGKLPKLSLRLGAICIFQLARTASARSEHETAVKRFEQALALYRRIGDVAGEANCIRHLGDIASVRSEHETAVKRFEEALALYRRIGNVVGEANCIISLGNIASVRFQHEAAVKRFEEALALYRRIGDVAGEANCISCLGDIASARSQHETAVKRFEEALALYRRIGNVVGEANCISCLGDIASERSEHETAVKRVEEALALYRRIGDVVGEANCLKRLGDIARARSEHETAVKRFEEALALYRRIGVVVGEANCLKSLGDIASVRSEHETAVKRFEEALALYRRIGNVVGEAETTIRRGQARRSAGDPARGIADIEAGFELYFSVADPEDRALAGWRAMHRSLVCEGEEAEKQLDIAKSEWIAIGRFDLVANWVEKAH